MTGQFSEETVQDMRCTKMIHSVASTYLDKLLRSGGQVRKGDTWTQDLFALLYAEFNADLVPRDFGGEKTLLTSVDIFWTLLTRFLPADAAITSAYSSGHKQSVMHRLQIIVFWLLKQRSHTSAKTWFTNLRADEPLAATALNPKAELPWSVVSEILLSLFRNHNDYINKEIAHAHVDGIMKFATPFGASVLRCGASRCAQSFVPEKMDKGNIKWDPATLDQLRQARAKHLIDAYGVSKAFVSNQTGLPESTTVPVAPSSAHVTLHISIARTWSPLSVKGRRAIIKSSSAGIVSSFLGLIFEHHECFIKLKLFVGMQEFFGIILQMLSMGSLCIRSKRACLFDSQLSEISLSSFTNTLRLGLTRFRRSRSGRDLQW
jgi:hypothetical protein